ncbi:MAG TPA: sulfotransferase domain-containing protein [Terriglobales bacterium]|jgi:hypothetical protein|nr:sulfotransferase domain-containing protein [Terriglobales bacterium]
MSAFTRFRGRMARTRLRSPLVWLRHLGLDASDVYLASYPRSGNTMLRFILAEVLSGVPSSFDSIQRIIPEIGVHVHAHPLLPGGGRLIKTHEPFRRKYRRAIYIVRDVRDVMLSTFARETAVDVLHIRDLNDYIRPFMQGRMTRFGSWQSHVESWLDSPLVDRGDLLVVRFEDIRSNLESAVAQCLDFLGKSAGPVVIRNAVRNNTLDRMRTKEDVAKTLPKSRDDAGRWIGRGSVAGWRGKLTEDQLEIVDEYACNLLAHFGYPTNVFNLPEISAVSDVKEDNATAS